MAQDKYNYGLSLLRVFLTIFVILNHFWESDVVNRVLMPLSTMRSVAVPTFMLMSFYLTARKISSGSSGDLKKRIVRLAIPFFVWGGVSWLLMFLIQKVTGMQIINGISALGWQLLTGHAFHVNAPLWYMAVLMWLTICFSLVFMTKNKRWQAIVLNILAVLALVAQYSGVNYYVFGDLSFELKYPLGRIAEMLPYATLGYDLAHFRVFDLIGEKVDNHAILFIGSLILLLIQITIIPVPPMSGFGYSGMYRIAASMLTFTLFYYLPLQWIGKSGKKIISVVTGHTLGVYCMHYLIGNILVTGIEKVGFSVNFFVLAVMIYAICYGIACFMCKIPNKFIGSLVD